MLISIHQFYLSGWDSLSCFPSYETFWRMENEITLLNLSYETFIRQEGEFQVPVSYN